MSNVKELLYHDPNALVIVGLDTTADEKHPLYNPDAFKPVNEELVKSIMVHGVQQVVMVRMEAGKCLVVDGRSRVKAAREAVKRLGDSGDPIKVPCQIKTADDKLIAGIMTLANEHRHTSSLLDKALAAARLSDRMGYDDGELAVVFGKSTTTIRNWKKVVEAIPEIHAAVRADVISFQVAIELSAFPRDEQLVNLERAIKAREKGLAPVPPLPTLDEDGGGKATTKLKDRKQPKHPQPGIKRTWIRDALLSETAKELSEEQRGLLTWLATGATDDEGAWYIEFYNNVEKEWQS